jgi:hypothetical protein
MPRGVHPSIVYSDRREVILSGFSRFLECGKDLIQVAEELHELVKRHIEDRPRHGGRQGSVLTLASVASLS